MKRIFVILIALLAFILTSALLKAQTNQPTIASPPLSQPLVREGDFAFKLADALNLGTAASETEAESLLSSVGIAPRNGWIADYPVTPDIIGELQTSVSEAADAGELTTIKDAVLSTFQNTITESNLSVKTDTSGQVALDSSGTNYPDSTLINNYYYDEGPPVVTYYAPPPPYAYLYSWVPYPFWWSDFWFPGFFVLVDFDIRVHGHDHRYDHERGHGEFISNHFRDPNTGRMLRIDPASRSHGGIFEDTGGTRWASPSARSGAKLILNNGHREGTATGVNQGFRGYAGSRPSVGTRSSAFDRSGNSQFERSASDRGFQSRSNAGQITNRDYIGGGFSGGRGGVSRGSGGGGFHGGGHR
jgi:hypothetical protein